MSSDKIKSFAKVNLDLKILKVRSDGYHDIQSLFHKITLYDELEFSDKSNGIEIISSGQFRKIPTNSLNTCFKAANILRSNFGIQRGICININKNIPIQAGLGGGSSDAASVLKYLNSHWDINLSGKELVKIGKLIGADVPFFLSRKNSANVEGIGDLIKYKKSIYSGKYISLFKPRYINISSKWAYQNLDKNIIGDKSVVNGFESTMFKLFPDLKYIKYTFEKSGATQANMTGSGSCIFGIFLDKKMAETAVKTVNLEGWNGVYKFL